MTNLAPSGWINSTTPQFATVKCGNYTQTDTYNTSTTTPVDIGFTTPSTWSDLSSFTSEDGITWDCQTTGLYNLRFNQTFEVENDLTPPESAITVIPNTTFFLDVSGTLSAPQTGPAILHPNVGTQSSIAHTTEGVVSDYLMATFVTPVGFLTSTVVPGAPWDLSIWASTTDTDELNTMYLRVYEVDADGISDPVLIFNGGAGTPFIVNTSAILNYNNTVNIPTFEVASLTRRLQFRLYANFGVASTITFYTRNLTTSSIGTSVSQDVVPLTRDTVNARITVTSATTEFNQVFASSVPVTMDPSLQETLIYSTSVNAIANVYAGDTVVCSLGSVLGNLTVTSGETSLPAPANTLQWNLIAEGAYGNADVVVAPMMAMQESVADILRASINEPVVSEPVESYTDESLANALRASL